MFTPYEWMLVIWLGMLGACIGSFLNVVIYRLPRGQNLARPSSRCPHCEAAIRPYHNIPVLGWLVLRGRCYDCKAPISARYPLIEAITAGCFVAVAVLVFGVIGTGIRNASGLDWGFYVGQMIAICCFVCSAAIVYDRQRVPRSIYLIMLIGIAVASICVVLR